MELRIRITMREAAAMCSVLAESQELAKFKKEVAEIVQRENIADDGEASCDGASSSMTSPAAVHASAPLVE